MTVKFDFKTLGQPFEADWPVVVKVPQDGGGFEEQTFMARLRMLSQEEMAKIEGDLTPHFFVGLGKGEPELTPELRAQLMAAGYVRTALGRAWQIFQFGAAAKN